MRRWGTSRDYDGRVITMSSTVAPYRWSVSEFLRAWEAGAFDHRVELIEGEVWPVVIGDWHGRMVGKVIGLLSGFYGDVTTATLPSGNSLPDPDCWVRRPHAEPAGQLGTRLSLWRPGDVLLVVEVSDDTVVADLNIKSRIYGSAGWPVYWVVTEEAIYEHTEPHSAGYHVRREYLRDDRLPISYAGTDVAVDDLLGPAPQL
jgi:Putative restriction endonuclease